MAYFCDLQMKTNTPVPDDLTDQSVPTGPVPPFPDVNELSRELPNLEPICKLSSIFCISSLFIYAERPTQYACVHILCSLLCTLPS
jgi:hypothetical protein